LIHFYKRTMENNYDSNDDSVVCSTKLKRASWSESDLRAWEFATKKFNSHT